MSEKKTVKEDELDSISGGNQQQATAGVRSQALFGVRNNKTVGVRHSSGFGFGFGNESLVRNKYMSGNRNYSGQCEPEEDETNPLQKPICSDPTNRGKKTECANCPAGIK